MQTALRAGRVLALLATATACGSETTLTGVSEVPTPSTVIETLKAPFTAPLTPTHAPMIHDTPQAGAGIATPAPTATPVPELSVQPAQALDISTKGALIRIAPIDRAYFTLEGDLFEKLKSLPHVSHVERYLVVELGAMESNDAIIRVEPGSPLRIVRGGDEVTATVYSDMYPILNGVGSTTASDTQKKKGPRQVGAPSSLLYRPSLSAATYPATPRRT